MTAVLAQSFYVEQVNDVTVVCTMVPAIVDGNYELISDELFELVEHITAHGPIQVVMDLGSLKSIDDWGVAMLRAFDETIESCGGVTIFCRLSDNVAAALHESGLSSSLRICETCAQAVWSF
ncbi:STAS domain-containing protein [Schlesneria sp. T3-172]|uniref:STAS domain-containing protein n=1 Tax=Schlesneria sphaerica TaxID=3373610 RepID=UPI0037CC022E